MWAARLDEERQAATDLTALEAQVAEADAAIRAAQVGGARMADSTRRARLAGRQRPACSAAMKHLHLCLLSAALVLPG